MDNKGIAIFPGAFKSPTLGHFTVAQNILDNPDINQLLILISPNPRKGIDAKMSKKIWEIYKPYLKSKKVTIQIADKSPVGTTYSLAKNTPDQTYYLAVGLRDESTEDLNRLNSATKYPNIKPLIVNTQLSTSATKAREALINKDKQEFFKLIPNIKEKEYIYNLLESLEITK